MDWRYCVPGGCGAGRWWLPFTHFVVDFSTRWNTVAVTVGPAVIVMLLGILRGVLDGTACLVGFVVLGQYLELRHRSSN